MKHQTTAEELAKASLPVAVTGMTIFGMSLPDWAALFAVIYTGWLIIEKICRLIRQRLNKSRRHDDK
jgi:hypothetical protein